VPLALAAGAPGAESARTTARPTVVRVPGSAAASLITSRSPVAWVGSTVGVKQPAGPEPAPAVSCSPVAPAPDAAAPVPPAPDPDPAAQVSSTARLVDPDAGTVVA
jgi:hypothetical protein